MKKLLYPGLPFLLVVMAALYVASPYIALWRLGAALRGGDAGFLASHVDWDAVRADMVQQVDNEIRGVTEPVAATADDELPGFGNGFVRGIAHRVVDRGLQPAAVQEALRRLAVSGSGGGQAALRWAFFDGPDSFVVAVAMARDGVWQEVRVHLRLSGTVWRVTGVKAPAQLLAGLVAHT